MKERSLLEEARTPEDRETGGDSDGLGQETLLPLQTQPGPSPLAQKCLCETHKEAFLPWGYSSGTSLIQQYRGTDQPRVGCQSAIPQPDLLTYNSRSHH